MASSLGTTNPLIAGVGAFAVVVGGLTLYKRYGTTTSAPISASQDDAGITTPSIDAAEPTPEAAIRRITPQNLMNIELSRAIRMIGRSNDELLTEYLEKHPRSREGKHFHQDGYQMVSLYLTFRYPDQYTLYALDRFKRLLTTLGTPEIPATHDFERFCKVTRTLWGFMQKDEALMEAHRARLEEGKHYQGESLLPVYELMQII